jgi:3-phytase
MINKKLTAALLASCSLVLFSQQSSESSDSLLRFEVIASVETTPVLSAEDAADDVCVWVPDTDAEPIFIIGTDKKRGLETYNERGERIFDAPFGRINNVDLWSSETGPIIVGTNRTTNTLDFYSLDIIDGSLELLNRYATGLSDVYGITVRESSELTEVFLSDKRGTVQRYSVMLIDRFVSARLTETFKFSSIVEGLEVDPFYQRLYVAQEDKGLWYIDLNEQGAKKVRFASVDKQLLLPDLEGLALLDLGLGEGYLAASVQGANAYALFDRKTLSLRSLFEIVNSKRAVGAVEETDGIEIINHPRFSFFIAQDGYNSNDNQNYKLVKLSEILKQVQP